MTKKTKWMVAAIAAAAVIIVAIFSAISLTKEKTKNEGEPVHITVMSWLGDPVQSGIEKMNETFMKEHPGVIIEYEAVTGDDYRTVLQSRFAANDAPDIFMNAGYYWLDLFGDKLAPVTDEEWAQYLPEASKQRWGKNGELYGFPINLQSISFIYNKELFEEAGITEAPETFEELKEACEKLEAVGITPFATCGSTTSKLAHSLNVAFGHQENPLGFIEKLRAGEAKMAENAAFLQWADYFDFTLQHSYGDVLTTDMDTVYTLFATGQVAIIQEGSWCEGSIRAINPEINIGIMPMSISENPEENLIAGDAADGFVITQNENTDICKELVAYWALSEEGLNIFKDYQMIPAMKNVDYNASELGAILEGADEYFKEGNYFGWYWYAFPDLTADMQLGAIMQAYIAGDVDKQGMLEQMDAKVAEIETKSGQDEEYC